MAIKTTHDACVVCVPCLTNGKLEDANMECIKGECPTCGFDKIWSKGLRWRLLVCESEQDKGEWTVKLNPVLCLATNE